jgi:hypothetical protein
LGAGIAGDGRRKLELQAYYFVCTERPLLGAIVPFVDQTLTGSYPPF